MIRNTLNFFLFFLLIDQVLPALHVFLSDDFYTPWIKLPTTTHYWLFLLFCIFWFVVFLFGQKTISQFQQAMFRYPFLMSGLQYRFVWLLALTLALLVAFGFFAAGMNTYRYSDVPASNQLVIVSNVFRALAYGFLTGVAIWRIKNHAYKEVENIFKKNYLLIIVSFSALLFLVSGTQDVLFIVAVLIVIVAPEILTMSLFRRRIHKYFFYLPFFGMGFLTLIIGYGEGIKRKLTFFESVEYIFSNFGGYMDWLLERYSTYHYSTIFWLTEQITGRADLAANWQVFAAGSHYRLFKIFGSNIEQPDVQLLAVVNYLNIHPFPAVDVGASAGVFGTPLMVFSFWSAPVFIGFYLVFVLAPAVRMLRGVHLNILGLFLMWILLRPFLLDPSQFFIIGVVPIMFISFLFALNYLSSQSRKYA